ncbi:MAG: response regulator receiver protein [Bacteriovoracaceae bacterium]|nr:response regulator receiver protein [Bacteriovoracaceae bacterium]
MNIKEKQRQSIFSKTFPFKTLENPLVLVSSFKKKPPTIMIIDDDVSSKNLYQLLLEKRGFRVLSAEDGLSAIEMLRKLPCPPDLLLVDCSMPKMDGEAFLLKLQEKLPQVFVTSKVVGFTSYDLRSADFKKIKELAFDCREKPFGVNEFLQLVSDYVEMPSDGTNGNLTPVRICS